MSSYLFTNSWAAGRNSDTTPNNLQPNQYRSADNVSLVGSGNFFALENIAGTTAVQQISGLPNFNVIAAFRNKYLIGGELLDGITIFSAGLAGTLTEDFKITAYIPSTDTHYELYEEAIPVAYNTTDRVVDAVNGPENGVDHLYFSDGYFEPRYFRCEIPDSYSANFLNSYDISLLRKGANGTISLTSISSGGTLLSGSYSFSYRVCNPTSKRFSRWQSLSTPVHVYDAANGNTHVHSGVGLVTDRKITLSITPSFEELASFGHIQLAVVENTGPSTTTLPDGTVVSLPQTASLLEIEELVASPHAFEYKSNSRINTVPIEDIIVDLAQIEKVKTLNIKDNRLFFGNITYTDLEFDNGVPAITSGSILRQADTNVDGFSSDDFASRYRGHMRDECYRYGAVFRDADGNAAPVQPLDLSGVTGNAITAGLKDMKFPSRSSSNLYTLFNSDGKIQSLGLRLTGLTNIPSWARSVEIVRLPRKKNILFQTPLIPMTAVHGIGAQSEYPTTYYNGFADVTVTDAQPMTAGHTLVTKNLFWPELREIKPNVTASAAAGGVTYYSAGEVKLARRSDYSFAAIFPDDSMYGDRPYVHTGGEKLDVIDYALFKMKFVDFTDSTLILSPNSFRRGDCLKTSIMGIFYALKDGQYYYDSSHSGKAAISYTNITLPDYEFFQNFGQPDSVGGNSVFDFESLQTKGISFWNFQPTVQKMGVVQFGSATISEGALTFSAGTLNAVGNGNFVIGSSGMTYEATNTLTNKYIAHYASFTQGSSYVSAIPIANVKLGLSDDRYGDLNDLHEYISTGTRYTFSEAEVATLEGGGDVTLGNLDVWGGDTVVGPKTFKICDSHYSVINQPKNHTPSSPDSTTTNIKKWEEAYLYATGGTDPVISLPVALENSAQYVQVVLESEYSEVMDIDALTTYSTESGVPISIPLSEGSMRTPLTYKYNLNLNKTNSEKIYVTEPEFSFKQNEFNSRVLYSDLKIYNSDQAGFDTFRVSNTFDLEEKYGAITKLAVAGNELYSINERGTIYLPTGERQLETTDAGTLAVRSGDVIGKPNIIDSRRGSQHLRGIVETGNTVYVPDAENKDIYILGGQQLQSITKDNKTIFRDMFSSRIAGGYLLGVYDPERQEYWIADIDPFSANRNCHVFNETINENNGGWVSNYPGFGRTLKGAVHTNQNLYVIGVNSSLSDTSVCTMYTGDVGQIFGNGSVANVEFVVNPLPLEAKTFDNITCIASERLLTADFEVPHESQQGNQTSSVTLDTAPREGKYLAKLLRDAGGARMRGMFMYGTVTWGSVQSALSSVGTVIRISARRTDPRGNY